MIVFNSYCDSQGHYCDPLIVEMEQKVQQIAETKIYAETWKVFLSCQLHFPFLKENLTLNTLPW